jgi:hypothetical protein
MNTTGTGTGTGTGTATLVLLIAGGLCSTIQMYLLLNLTSTGGDDRSLQGEEDSINAPRLTTTVASNATGSQQQQAMTPAVDTPRSSYSPTYFRDEIPFDRLLLEEHIINERSGCNLASWVYPNPHYPRPGQDDCEPSEGRDVASPTQLQDYDTLYVPFFQLWHFADFFLPNLTAQIVVLSGQSSNLDPQKYLPIQTFHKVVDSPHVMHWFVQNKPRWAWPQPNHAKISSFPYGVKQREMAEAFFRLLIRHREAPPLPKVNVIFASPLGKTGPSRASMPTAGDDKKLEYSVYLREMGLANYTLSPNGDRPDCFRHYEAIGMGSVPITELQQDEYEHFGDNVIYNNTDWDLAILRQTLPEPKLVNRKLVLEEYWMEYMERRAGHPLRVWDQRIQARMLVSTIAERIRNANLTKPRPFSKRATKKKRLRSAHV